MKLFYALSVISLLMIVSCTNIEEYGHQVKRGHIYPDYAATTLPCNISPISFFIGGSNDCRMKAVLTTSDKSLIIRANNGQVNIKESDWRDLLQYTDSIVVTIEDEMANIVNSFPIYISSDSIDPYMAYRLIEPGYEVWNQMGIYQRNLETFDESAIITNIQTDNGCMNCHSFCQRNPDKMLLHMRKNCSGTYILKNGSIEKLNTKTPQTISDLVYPSWHPNGRYVAFSTNITKQMFHTSDKNRIEVFDTESDVVVYDTETHQIVSCPQLKSKAAYETFPTFSADGKRLYFCTADSVTMPQEYEKIKYSLCSMSFDESKCTFGINVDTIVSVRRYDKSVSFPRISPNGRWLLISMSDYGNFSIWHKESDLYIIDLNNENKVAVNMATINSDDVDSYHSWSSNSRWVLFSSRRLDGLYTRPFIAHIDETGKASKPFVVPQADAFYYDRLMKSYNIPELISGKVEVNGYELSKVAHNESGYNLIYLEPKLQRNIKKTSTN